MGSRFSEAVIGFARSPALLHSASVSRKDAKIRKVAKLELGALNEHPTVTFEVFGTIPAAWPTILWL